MKKLYIYALFLGVMCAFSSCKDQQKETGTLHSVVLVDVQGAGNMQSRSFSGTVEEGREISVGFKIDGQLSRVCVKEGDYVREGQLVAQMDDKDYLLGVEAAQIQYDQLKSELERMKKLYDAQSLSANDYEKAQSGLKQLAVNLKVYQNKVKYTKLYAPSSGYVQKVNFEAAEMVGAGTEVITLLDVRNMEACISIPASIYAIRDRIKSFSVDGTHTLNLISITPKADSNQLYQVRLGLPSSLSGKVTSGQNIEVTIELQQEDDTPGIIVPLSAVSKDGGKECVYVYNAADSTVHSRQVRIGKMNDEGKVVVLEGLKDGEKVVKAGVTHLKNGEKVKIAQL